MNEELKKIITTLIDKGDRNISYYEDITLGYKWSIEKNDYTLSFDFEYWKGADTTEYRLALFNKNEYTMIDLANNFYQSKELDSFIKKVKEVGFINV